MEVYSDVKKIIFPVIIAIAITFNAFSQESSKSFEQTAFDYFCKNKTSFDAIGEDVIVFNDYTYGMSPNIYDIASCQKEINLWKDSIPNKDYLDSIDKYYKSHVERNNKPSLSTHCNATIKKHKLFQRDFYVLNLHNAIFYKGYYFVELSFLNRKQQRIDIVVIKLDNDKNILGHCNYGYTYD